MKKIQIKIITIIHFKTIIDKKSDNPMLNAGVNNKEITTQTMTNNFINQ